MIWIERNPKDTLDSICQDPNLALNTSRDEASITALDNLYQCLTIFYEFFPNI